MVPSIGANFRFSPTVQVKVQANYLHFVALVSDETRPASEAVAQRLRARGIPTEVAASAQKFGKQIRYAERRGIPFVWFPGADGAADQVKDIRSGDQADADPDRWVPPDDDLHPQVVTQETKEQQQ